VEDERKPTKVLMKKFRITATLSQSVELTVWSASEETAHGAFTRLSDSEFHDLLTASDAEREIDVNEIKEKNFEPEDGIVVPNGRWRDGAALWTENDETFEPTDDPMEALPEKLKDILAAERGGARPLPGFATLHEAMGIPLEVEKAKGGIVTLRDLLASKGVNMNANH